MRYFNPSIHHRRSCRLNGYDYSGRGFYFITNCCQNLDYLFGHVINGELIPNEAGRMVAKSWLALPERFRNIKLHEFVVMPNHFHGIIEITAGSTLVVDQSIQSAILIEPAAGSTLVVDLSPMFKPFNNQNDIGENIGIGQPQGLPGRLNNLEIVKNRNITIGNVMDAFKSITTVEYIRGVKYLKWKPFYKKVWQRDYFDVIIRNDTVLDRISKYIQNNPKKWRNDNYHPSK